MKSISEALRDYLQAQPFDSGDPDCKTMLDQLYHAYAESHENSSAEIQAGFTEPKTSLKKLPLSDNNAVFHLSCRIYTEYERKGFKEGLLYGVHLIWELKNDCNAP